MLFTFRGCFSGFLCSLEGRFVGKVLITSPVVTQRCKFALLVSSPNTLRLNGNQAETTVADISPLFSTSDEGIPAFFSEIIQLFSSFLSRITNTFLHFADHPEKTQCCRLCQVTCSRDSNTRI